MDFEQDGLSLAAARREKFFAALPEDIEAVIACDPVNRGYLSGYFSMGQDVNPGYKSAAVATRESVVLVVGAADAGPALEWLGDAAAIFRYGAFFFETDPNHVELEFQRPAYADFDSALAHALEALAKGEHKIGIDFPDLDKCSLSAVLGLFSANKFVSVSGELAQARRFKLSGEVERLRYATRLVERGLETVRANLKTGMAETEVAALIAAEMVAGGGIPRFISVTSGPRSALADAYPTHRTIKTGELVRIDAGCVVEGFCSDMARTFIIGEPDKIIRRRYDAIAEGLERELRSVKAGIPADRLYRTAVETVQNAGIPDYRRHHCGHGLGIGGYESPLIAAEVETPIEAGICLSLETPYYELGWGGMMVEDTILVTEDGYEPITAMPRELIVV